MEIILASGLKIYHNDQSSTKDMKNNIKKCLLALTAIVGLGSLGSATAAVTLYASYDNDLNLNIGSPSTATVTGSVSLVAGSSGNGTAAYFDPAGWASTSSANTDFLTYGQASNYLSSYGNNQAVGSATFRILYKPSDTLSIRKSFIGTGLLGGAGNGAYLSTDDATKMPGIRLTINGVFQNNLLSAGSGFTWDTSKWYYIAGSFDASGSIIYVRELTSGSTVYTNTLSYSATNWGAGWDTSPMFVGSRFAFGGNGGVENARGALDEALIADSEKWNLSQFNADFLTLVPEPGTLALMAVSLMGLFFFRRRRVVA